MAEIENMPARTVLDAVCEGDHRRRLIKSPRPGAGWYDEYGYAWRDEQIESWSVFGVTGAPATPGYQAPSFEPAQDDAMPSDAEPVSIVDMAPGTLFWAKDGKNRWRWLSRTNSSVASVVDLFTGQHFPAIHIDPSTIRDVTPPEVTR